VELFAGVLLVDPSGRILLQERDEFPVIDPEKWGLVGGHLDPDEDFEAGAYRELAEETGIRLPPRDLAFWREFEVYHAAYDQHGRMQVFIAASVLTDADIVVGEGRQIVFVAPEQARGLDLTSSASLIVPAFLDSATYRGLLA
jgi:8-oxo-dGTP diphosphatase